MKKQLLFIVVLLVSAMTFAQSTYSRYDVNHDGKETIEDITILTNRLLGRINYPVTSITLSQSEAIMCKGTTATLTFSVLPADADNTTVTWSSSDVSVATVENGVIAAVATGTTTITATANDGSGVIATCSVTVTGNSFDSHEYVDLGLPSGTLWAKTNIGAENIYDYGDYFAWGETSGYNSGKTNFSTGTYQYYKTTTTTTKDADGFDVTTTTKGYTKYVSSSDSSYGYDGFYDDQITLEASDDAATVNWGDNWRMPTDEEWLELYHNCTWTACAINNVQGYKISASNENYIFLPAAGYRTGTHIASAGSRPTYWRNSLYTSNDGLAWELYFDKTDLVASYYPRYIGLTIRPVRSK